MYENELWYRILEKGTYIDKNKIYIPFKDVPQENIDIAIIELFKKGWIRQYQNMERNRIGFLKWEKIITERYAYNSWSIPKTFRFFEKKYPELFKKVKYLKRREKDKLIKTIEDYFKIKFNSNRKFIPHELLHHLKINNFDTTGEKP